LPDFQFSRRTSLLLVAALVLPLAVQAATGSKVRTRTQAAPVPAELRSTAFSVKVNGKPVDVAHAAASYEFVSFAVSAPATVEITAAQPGFWDRGVDIHPWRLGLRPVRQGQTIRLQIPGPVKLSISRPRDFLNHARMLFLFAGKPAQQPRDPAIRVYKPGVYRESLNPKSNETIYLAPGSYFFGSLNLWKVHDVKILGQGTIVYDGPQDPVRDEGWMQKPDWHCVGALEARNVEIDGLTCVVRSRTWSIQMTDSTGFVFDDVKVIGGNPGNANQDGMDWLGGGDAVVRNSFLRTSDDVFAMQGNWDGYTEEDMVRPGHDVQNIVIEHSELSTSISNIVRAGWPQKVYNSRNFTLRDSDILHGGIGACGQDFGVLGFWGEKGARGEHTGFTFENLFLDNWYSLVQLEQEEPQIDGVRFRNIWALDQPPLVASTITGQVKNVTFENVKLSSTSVTGDADLPLVVSGGAEAAHFVSKHSPFAGFTIDPPIVAPGKSITFAAQPVPGTDKLPAGLRYTWLFGDGTTAHGQKVRHRFRDVLGTELDGSGRFRVLLHVEDRKGNEDWASQGVVAVGKWLEDHATTATTALGLGWQIYPGEWTELPNLISEHAVLRGESPNLLVDSEGYSRYAAAWDGFIDIPADGGYSFYLLAKDGARLVIDGHEIAKTGPPFAEVCGSLGNAVRYDMGSAGLRAGKHTIHIEGLHAMSQGFPRLLWEGPMLPLTDVPAAAYSHLRSDAVTR
jgi:hypothetical protein